MKQSKEHYLSPEAELLVVRFEKAILSGGLRAPAAASSFDDDEADVMDGSSSIFW